MPFTLTMPKLSPTMEEGTIAKWHKHVGDFIKADDLLFEVATDKATVEYNAIDSGWLRKILISDGQEAIVNQAIAIFTEDKNENIDNYTPTGVSAKPSTPSPTPETKSEKLTPTQPSTATPLPPPPPPPPPPPQRPSFSPETPPPITSTSQQSKGRVKASPLARKLAQQKGLDLSTINGSGPGNRIVSRDLAHAKPLTSAAFSHREQPTVPAGSYTEEALTPMRKVISQRLQEAKTYIPHIYISLKINAQPLVDIREQLRNHDIKLTYNDFIVRACALALRKHPNVNSGFNASTNTLIRFKTIDISIAVSVQGGLITPIVRHADFKNIGELATEIKSLAARAKEGKLDAHEYKGGSFTITNLGMYGVSEFMAIINPPQAAILAVSGILPVPVIRNGQIIAGNEMTLTLSADHRVIDGVASAEFLNTLQSFLENPAILLT